MVLNLKLRRADVFKFFTLVSDELEIKLIHLTGNPEGIHEW